MDGTMRGRAASLAMALVALGAVAGCGSRGPGGTDPPIGSPTAAVTAPPATVAEPTAQATEPPRNPAALAEDRPYVPVLDPNDFVLGIDNRYYPLEPGTTLVFEGGTERIEVEVTSERRTVMGVSTVVVHDRVWDAGVLIEDTFDWYAQDRWGNVWYFGEATTAYEDGVASTAGSWEAGVDGALPGIVMLARPEVGDAYRQEFYAGEAEDLARIVRIGGSVTVAAGTFDAALVTEDWTLLEPGVTEEKTYVPGIGFVFERFIEGGEGTIELVEIHRPD